MNIEIISGSPHKDSVTHRVVLFLQKHLSQTTKYTVKVIDVRDWNINVLQQEVYKNIESTPAIFQPLARRIFNANAFLVVTPEYNGSYTPALKNLFDHFPKQAHKAFAIVTASPGVLGGVRASQQMQLLINALFGIASPYMLITPQVDKKFDEHGNLIDINFQKSIDVFVDEFLWLAEHIVSKEVHPAE